MILIDSEVAITCIFICDGIDASCQLSPTSEFPAVFDSTNRKLLLVSTEVIDDSMMLMSNKEMEILKHECS